MITSNALSITKKEIVTIQDSDGFEIKPGDPIMVRVRNQDFVCRFVGIEKGYFVTKTLDDGLESKFRQVSIQKCARIEGVTLTKKEEE